MQKKQRLTLRVHEQTVAHLKKEAEEVGTPLSALISNVLYMNTVKYRASKWKNKETK